MFVGRCSFKFVILGSWVITTLVSAGCSDAIEKQANLGNSRPVGHELSLQCETKLKNVRASDIHNVELKLTSGPRIGRDSQHPVGAVLGAEWSPRTERLYVLDGYNKSIEVYDDLGRHIMSMGQEGEGPGEFEFLDGGTFEHDQLTLIAEDVLAVRSSHYLHLFGARGEFIWRTQVPAGMQSGPYAVLQAASISDSAFLFSTTGAFDLTTSDYQKRAGLTIWMAELEEDSLHVEAFGRMDNELVRFPPFARYPPRDPYRSVYERRWDADGSGILAILSMKQHGVCFYDSEGRLLSGFQVEGPIVKTEGREQKRILDSLRTRFGPKAPMTGESWNNFYDWPEAAPRYIDVVLGPDSTAWLERAVSNGMRKVDLVNLERGYLGTVEPLDKGLPVTLSEDCAFVVEEVVPATKDISEAFYGLRKRCYEEDSNEWLRN